MTEPINIFNINKSPEVQLLKSDVTQIPQSSLATPEDAIANRSNFSNGENDVESASLVGQRIIDVGWFFQQFDIMAHHNIRLCTFNDVKFVSEQRMGLHSTFTWKCEMCHEVFKISSEEPVKAANKMNINMCAVSAAISVGCGFRQMQEMTAVMDIPFMSNATYSKNEDNIHNAWMDTALDEMKSAAQQEILLAKAANEVDEEGIPEITVAVDGAWSKRSYRTNYNALSGNYSLTFLYSSFGHV